MKIAVNGESVDTREAKTIAELIDALSIAAAIDFGGAQRPRRASTRMAKVPTC